MSSKIAVRHPLSRHRVRTSIEGESKTHQAHKERCDLGNIIRQYDNTGLFPDGRPAGSYIDCTQLQNKSRADLILEQREKAAAAAKRIKDANAPRS